METTADAVRTRKEVGLRNVLDDGGLRSTRAPAERAMAIRVRARRCGAHRTGFHGRVARPLHADAPRDTGDWVRDLRDDAAAPVRARGRRPVLAEASYAHRAAARQGRRHEAEMIARHWRGLAKSDQADDYVEHLRRETLPSLARIEGFISASIM